MSCGFRLEVQAVIQVRCVVLEALWVGNMFLEVSSGRGVHQNHPGRRRRRRESASVKKKIDSLAHPGMFSESGSQEVGTQASVFLFCCSQGLGALGPLEMLVLCLGLWAPL